METTLNILAFIAGEALCVAALAMAVRLGWATVANLTWDSYGSKQWSGPLEHYVLNIGLLALAAALMAISIAFAVVIPYILWGGA